jgi:hypothetical protein
MKVAPRAVSPMKLKVPIMIPAIAPPDKDGDVLLTGAFVRVDGDEAGGIDGCRVAPNMVGDSTDGDDVDVGGMETDKLGWCVPSGTDGVSVGGAFVNSVAWGN